MIWFSQSLSIFPFTKHTSHIFARLFRAQRCTLLRHAMLKLRDRSSLSEGSSYMYKRSSRKYWHQKLRCFCVTKQKPTKQIWKIRISQHILKRQPKQEAIFTSSTPYSPIPDILSICWIFLAHWHISQSDKSHASTLKRRHFWQNQTSKQPEIKGYFLKESLVLLGFFTNFGHNGYFGFQWRDTFQR